MATKEDYIATRNFTRKYLLDHNFRYQSTFSDDEEAAYSYRFPVYRNGDFIVLDCEVVVFIPTNKIWVNIYERNTRTLYAPWYYTEYGNYSPILGIINNNVEKELNRLGVIRDGDDNCRANMRKVQTGKHSKRRRKSEVEGALSSEG